MINSLLQNSIKYIVLLVPLALVTGPALPDILISISSLFFLILSIKNSDFSKFKNTFFLIFIVWNIYLILNSMLSEFSNFSIRSSIFYFRFGVFSLCVWYCLENFKNFAKYFFTALSFALLFVSIDALIEYIFFKNILVYILELYSNIFSLDKFQDANLNPGGYKHSSAIQHYIDSQYSKRLEGRISGVFGSELILGSYISRLLPLFYALILLNCYGKIKNIYFHSLLLGSTLFFSLTIFFSGERMALINLLIFLLTFIFLSKNFKRFNFLLISIILFSVISIFNLDDVYKKRIISTTNKQINLTTNIFEISKPHEFFFKNAYSIYKSHKFFGTGPNTFRLECLNVKNIEKTISSTSGGSCSTHPHNTYLQLLSETGIIGLIPILSLLSYILYFFTLSFYQKLFNKIDYNKFQLVKICLFSCILISIWPIGVTGNFFNNWVSSVYFLPIGFILYINDIVKKRT